MSGKLGVMVQHATAATGAWLERARPRMVKWLEFPPDQLARVHAWGGVNVGRLVTITSQNPVDTIAQLRHADTTLPGLVDYWELVNEPDASATGLHRLNDYSMAVIAALQRPILVGNLGEGNPPSLEDWSLLFPCMRLAQQHGGGLALHEYGAPSPQASQPWHTLRYRLSWERFAPDLRGIPLFITEFGIDGAVIGQGGKGWLDFTDAPGYAQEITWYAGELAKDEGTNRPNVKGAHLFVLGHYGPWEHFDVLDYPQIADAIAGMGDPAVADFDSPNHGPARPTTTGVVLHATRGGGANLGAEYDGTVAWFMNPASQVSANSLCGPDGEWLPVAPELESWHAREYNATHLGLEMTQAAHGDPIPEAVIDRAAARVAAWHTAFGFPLQWDLTTGLCEHWEIPPGIREGKTDVQAPFDRAAFLAKVISLVEDPLTAEQKQAVLDDLDFLWAYSTAEQTQKDPAEAEKIMHERIVALKVTLGLQ